MSVSYPLREQWLGNVRGDVLSGILVALALIPEAIAFSLIAGVDPKVGLYASFCIAVITAIAGGRPGMISAATGAMALLMVDLVKDHGLQYLFAATIRLHRGPSIPVVTARHRQRHHQVPAHRTPLSGGLHSPNGRSIGRLMGMGWGWGRRGR